MGRKIQIIDGDVIITEGNKVIALKVDETNEVYQKIKAETNNFTENMNQKDPIEMLEQTQADLIFNLMINGVI